MDGRTNGPTDQRTTMRLYGKTLQPLSRLFVALLFYFRVGRESRFEIDDDIVESYLYLSLRSLSHANLHAFLHAFNMHSTHILTQLTRIFTHRTQFICPVLSFFLSEVVFGFESNPAVEPNLRGNSRYAFVLLVSLSVSCPSCDLCCGPSYMIACAS